MLAVMVIKENRALQIAAIAWCLSGWLLIGLGDSMAQTIVPMATLVHECKQQPGVEEYIVQKTKGGAITWGALSAAAAAWQDAADRALPQSTDGLETLKRQQAQLQLLRAALHQ
jgi:hypothetical protein